MTDLSKLEVKPCPHCGIELKRMTNYWQHEKYDGNESCILDGLCMNEIGLKKWNRRAPPKELVEIEDAWHRNPNVPHTIKMAEVVRKIVEGGK